jgi:hypothetical protein
MSAIWSLFWHFWAGVGIGSAIGAAVVAVLIFLPPKWDPAIRWKERQEGWRDRKRDK